MNWIDIKEYNSDRYKICFLVFLFVCLVGFLFVCLFFWGGLFSLELIKP